MASKAQEKNEKINKAIESLYAQSSVEISPKIVLELYIALLQNSTFQAMLVSSIAQNKGFGISREDLKRLDEKNDEYQAAIENFLLTVAGMTDDEASSDG